MEDRKNIIIDLKKKYLKFNKINNFFNENIHDCLICYNKLNDNGLILVNNFCNCYKNLFICDKCFINWYITDNRCFVCHIKFIDIISKKPVYIIKIPIVKEKLLFRLDNVRTPDINRYNIYNQYSSNILQPYRILQRDSIVARLSRVSPVDTSSRVIINRRDDIIPRDVIMDISDNGLRPTNNNSELAIPRNNQYTNCNLKQLGSLLLFCSMIGFLFVCLFVIRIFIF